MARKHHRFVSHDGTRYMAPREFTHKIREERKDDRFVRVPGRNTVRRAADTRTS